MEIEPQTIVSSIAAAIAAGAALIAWRSSIHAKRNADKALGEIDPFIEVFQIESTLYGGGIPRVAVQITNYNRRAMLLRRLEFETNDGFIAYRISDHDDQMALAGIVDAIIRDEGELDEVVQYSYDPPLRLPGNRSLGTNPPNYEFLYQVTEKVGRTTDWRTIVGINIEYAIDGTDKVHKEHFEREIMRNGVTEFTARFRSLPGAPKLDVE
jgi:hypothetical protein